METFESFYYTTSRFCLEKEKRNTTLYLRNAKYEDTLRISLTNPAKFYYRTELHMDLYVNWPYRRFHAGIIYILPFDGISYTDMHHVPDENNIIRTFPLARRYYARARARGNQNIRGYKSLVNSAPHFNLTLLIFPSVRV